MTDTIAATPTETEITELTIDPATGELELTLSSFVTAASRRWLRSTAGDIEAFIHSGAITAAVDECMRRLATDLQTLMVEHADNYNLGNGPLND